MSSSLALNEDRRFRFGLEPQKPFLLVYSTLYSFPCSKPLVIIIQDFLLHYVFARAGFVGLAFHLNYSRLIWLAAKGIDGLRMDGWMGLMEWERRLLAFDSILALFPPSLTREEESVDGGEGLLYYIPIRFLFCCCCFGRCAYYCWDFPGKDNT